MNRSVVVTGTGLVCAAGCGVAPAWEALWRKESGLGPLTLFSSPRWGRFPVGEVRLDVGARTADIRGSRTDRLAWMALQEALLSAGLGGVALNPERTAFCFGGTVGGMGGTERWLEQRLTRRPAHHGLLRFHECATTADLCAARLRVRGPVLTFSTACSASALALASAARLLRDGEADVVLAGGADALCRLTLNGFGSLLLLDPAGCRPFDERRVGISLGEAGAFLVLERAEHAAARGATALASLSGWGASCDAHHPTAPDPEGRGAADAMRSACARAGIQPAEVGYVCAHGTGTPDNDAMESRAIRSVFGDSPPPVASWMRLTGHTLGASGAVKAVLCVEALRRQILPPSLGCDTPDPALALRPLVDPRPGALRALLSNSFGFGGNNVSLVFTPFVPGAGDAARAGGRKSPADNVESPRSTPRCAVVGAGLVGLPGDSLEDAASRWSAEAPPPGARGEEAVVPADRNPPCGFQADTALDPARRRRLSRLQQMSIAAVRQALPPGSGATGDRVAVAWGTGLGSLSDTAAFLENMILKEEKAPRPGHFTNSVHNALAAQLALEWGFRGVNCTVTQREVSFEAALWHGVRTLRDQSADLLVAGAADEWTPHLDAVYCRWRSIHAGAAASPGEGCAAFVLARREAADGVLGWLRTVEIGRVAGVGAPRLDPVAEAEWVQTMLTSTGVPLSEVGAFLVGAPDIPAYGGAGLAVGRELRRRAGTSMSIARYAPGGGPFDAASAFGFLAALLLVQARLQLGAEDAEGVQTLVPVGAGAKPQAPRIVVTYTVSRSGGHALCCLESPHDTRR